MKHLMKSLGLILAVPLAYTGVLLAQATLENPKFTLTIKTEKAQVAKGEDVAIAITIKNISEDPIRCSFGYYGRMPDGYQFEIRDDQGNEVQRFGPRYKQLPNGKTLRLPDRPAGSERYGDVAPGKSVEEHATISDEYPFDRPGKYTIRVWKPATLGSVQAPDTTRIYSNTITITILASEETPPAD